jgi:flagellar basal-body rod modification protein FlgD
MTVNSTTSTPTTTATSTSSQTGAAALSQLTNNFQTFLSLLTTQLKNQDPLSPLDSNQFTQQLVQMSGVEAQLAGNNLLQQVASNTSNGVSTAVSLIGKNVKAVSDSAALTGGKAQWTYNLPSDATDLKLEVLDSTGKVVHAEAPSDMKAGDHDYAWNGKDMTGTTLPDGTYTLRVTATDAKGEKITTTSYVKGTVSAVEQSNGATTITVNGTKVPWNSVATITDAAASGSATSTAQGS